MEVADLLIDPLSFWAGWDRPGQPAALVQLDRCPEDIQLPILPPVPVIGIGSHDHPLADSLDVIVEPPVSVESLMRQIIAEPKAAASVVQLLRSTEGLGLQQALIHESFCYGMLQGSEEHARWLEGRSTEPANMSEPGQLIVRREGEVLHLTLDHPEARNAINRTMRDDLHEAFSLVAMDTDIRSVKLRATGSSFSMGADLGEFGTTRDPATAHMIRCSTLPALALSRRPEIVDVHVQGACVGAGLEIAAFAGRVTAGPKAWFQLPELSMGIIPGAGGCVSVPRRIGRQRAALMILSGKRINALTALEWGLVDEIVDDLAVDEGGSDQIG